MDREQEEMQYLGLIGIYLESYKLILKYKKIFTQITLTLILPLSFIFLAHLEVTSLILSSIIHDKRELHRTPANFKRFAALSDDWALFWLFKFLYFTFLLVFSLLSTSAVVYTVASVYTSRDVTFRRVIGVVPTVWKRLMVTFLCTFIAFFAFNFVAVGFFFALAFTFGFSSAFTVGVYILLFLYVAGFVYLTVIWHLASVVSVLEDLCGFGAMAMSKDLIKGKMVIAIVIFFKLNLSLSATQILFDKFVVHGELGVAQRIVLGLVCFLLLMKLILFWLVIQTIIYFVCKSYHHENIDKSALSDHLEVYLGEYVPLKAKDVQLEQYNA